MIANRVKHCGFTIIELLITIIMMSVLVVSITFVYRACFKTFNASESRSQTRTQLSEAVDIISRNLWNAQSISVCNATTLTFYAMTGSGASTQTYTLSGNNLETTSGAIIAAGVQPQSTVVSWGTTPALFSCSNGVVTIDITAVNNGGTNLIATNKGETVHVQTYVRTRDIPQGLVGWWQFDEAASGTCSNSGAYILDSSGNNNPGTCHGSPTWTTPKVGAGAMSFSGSSQYVTVSSFTSSITAPFSFSLWFNLTSNTSGMNDELMSTRQPSEYGIDLSVNYPTFGLHGDIGNGSTWLTTSADVVYTFTTGVWYHLAAVYTSSGYTYYINGASVGSGSISSGALFTNSTHSLTFAGINGTGNFPGYIDDVRVYNRALSAGEVLQLYDAG